MLDPQNSNISAETPEEIDLRLYKTTNRAIYDEATARTRKCPACHEHNEMTITEGVLAETNPKPEILLHSNGYLLETATSNIAIQSHSGEWVTPRLDRGNIPFLDGVMRRYLIEQEVIRESDLTAGDYEQAKKEGRRVIGFNGLR